MVNTSKILTVSYGTFSCTLEGFDDSFDMMKAIAEYFRDLAADDRYFGAEPPTPDADMLARIAEREMSRRVEARMERTGIVLRPAAVDEAAPATEKPAAQATSTEARAPAHAPAASPAPAAPAPFLLEDSEDDSAATFFSQPQTAAEPASGDSLIERLKRIRAAAAAQAAEAASEVDAAEETPATVRPEVTPAPVVTTEEVTEPPVADETPSAPAEADATQIEEEAADDSGEDDTALIAALASTPAPAASPVTGAVTDDAAEDDIATAATAEEPETASDATAEDTTEDTAEEAAAPAHVSMRFDAFTQDVTERLSETPSDATPSDDPVEAESSEAETVAEDSDEEEEVTVEIAVEGEIVENWFDEAATEDAEEPAANFGVKLASLDGLEDYEDTSDKPEAALLSPEEEEELARELAELATTPAEEVETAISEDDEVEGDAPAAAAAVDDRCGRDILEGQPNGGGDVDRIMSRTDDHLSEPEGERRRAAIAQLRAAVAATEAARQLGDKPEDAEAAKEPFRDDLKKAVKPRSASGLLKAIRGSRSKTDNPRPERPRPAPMRLVAEQRVDDTAQPAATQAPRPARTVATPRAAATPVISGYDSFSDFVESMGAHGLGDLLEAAAAYTAFVEGAEDFSRPELIQKVREVHNENFSREDGLRFFGTLLREGRINKVSSGRFQVADSTRFRPTQKAASN